MRMLNYFWYKLKVVLICKRIGVAVELNVYFKRMFKWNKSVKVLRRIKHLKSWKLKQLKFQLCSFNFFKSEVNFRFRVVA